MYPGSQFEVSALSEGRAGQLAPAERAEGYLHASLSHRNLPVLPVFKNKTRASLNIYYDEKAESRFSGMMGKLF
jgi:hypothetical protein